MDKLAPSARNRPLPAWRIHCSDKGIDPAEIEMVANRYRAYRDFMQPRGGGLPRDGWFRFYRLEKQSESPDQTGGVVSGCSATGEAVTQNVLSSPVEFYAVLKEQLTEQPESL